MNGSPSVVPMLEVREANESEIADWSNSWNRRLHDWYGNYSPSQEWIDAQTEGRRATRAGRTRETYVLMLDGESVGFIARDGATFGPNFVARLADVWVEPAMRRRGIGTAARLWAEQWAQSAGYPLMVTIDPADPASSALFATYPVRFQTMMKRLVPTQLPDGVRGLPMTEAEFDAWRSGSINGYAAEMADSGVLEPAAAKARAVEQFNELLPEGLATADHTFWTVYAGAEPVATNWLGHRYEPDTSFVYAIEVEEAYRGRGYGRVAMTVGELASIEAGDTQLGLNVFGHNRTAINLYTRMGYQIVDQGRSTAVEDGSDG